MNQILVATKYQFNTSTIIVTALLERIEQFYAKIKVVQQNQHNVP